jgi:hypothetical protein
LAGDDLPALGMNQFHDAELFQFAQAFFHRCGVPQRFVEWEI